MRHLVLGTAGHVDHGKTALIKALTGIDTDRLKEEKERGITIELGFASLKLPSGQTLGIVDVPGHEKFIKNMVAGAAGIDLVMLVIAADEGIMPQTKEHLHICSLLGISKGIVALTKTDIVEKEWLNLVLSETIDFLKGTFLEGSPVIPVSSIKEEGLSELIQALDATTNKIAEKADDGIFRLPVDRIFTMKGFGTVVTGTLLSDHVKTGEEVQILPHNIPARIRGIQVHNQPVEEAWSGQRTAINLQGLEKSAINRGNVLARPQTVWPTQRLDVFVEFLASNSKNLKNRFLVRLHTGTSEIISRIILLDKDELAPGQKGFAQIVLSDKGVVVARDHFVLRSYSPVTTIGGGQIIDPLPQKHKRFNKKIIEDLNLLRKGSLQERISVILERTGFTGISLQRLAFRLGVKAKKIKESLEILRSDKKAFLLDNDDTMIISAHFFNQLEEIIIKNVMEYHRKNPLKEGIFKEELKVSMGDDISPKLFNMVLDSLNKKGSIARNRDNVRLAKHQVELAGDLGSLRRDIAGIYNEAGLTPSSLKEVLNRFSNRRAKAQSIIDLMLKEGDLIKINEELCFSRKSLENLQNNYTEMLIKDGKATPASFKELTGLSRKYIIPLMEYFDMKKLTVRVDDHRVLRKKV
ncbi:MAG: selenocysteine-specific translation elongation factor [Syntrophaceae bacterium]|nr:selenocysteine-specific translation elongation factor [Syntrophaceae bacterium]